jgi:hypothetical protein
MWASPIDVNTFKDLSIATSAPTSPLRPLHIENNEVTMRVAYNKSTTDAGASPIDVDAFEDPLTAASVPTSNKPQQTGVAICHGIRLDLPPGKSPKKIPFAYAVAATSTPSSPSSNVPMRCPICPAAAPCVWRYNLFYHM